MNKINAVSQCQCQKQCKDILNICYKNSSSNYRLKAIRTIQASSMFV